MSDDYLWDKSGEPDPDLDRLERALARYRHVPQEPGAFPREAEREDLGGAPAAGRAEPEAGDEIRGAGQEMAATHRTGIVTPFRGRRRLSPGLVGVLGLAAAAACVVVLAGAALYMRAIHPTVEVARLEGSPTIGSRTVVGSGRLAVGERLRTDGASRARIDVGLIGQVVVEPDSRIALAASGTREQRLSLEVGTIRARIWAPPGLFRVDVPSALAVDMGCSYTLSVDPSRAGLLRVTQGWVAFTHDGIESFVPQGAACRTRPGVGPGTPYREDASAMLIEALGALDFEDPGHVTVGAPNRRAAALEIVLDEARPSDALTLWHLLGRLPGEERPQVYARLAQLVPPPDGVTREGILAGDRRMRDLWWDALGLNSASFWRRWEGAWPLAEHPRDFR